MPLSNMILKKKKVRKRSLNLMPSESWGGSINMSRPYIIISKVTHVNYMYNM